MHVKSKTINLWKGLCDIFFPISFNLLLCQKDFLVCLSYWSVQKSVLFGRKCCETYWCCLLAMSNWLASLTHHSRWPLGPTRIKICSMHTRLSTVSSGPLWSKKLSSYHHSQHYQGPKKESLLFNTCILWEADLWYHLSESVASN